MDIEEACMSNAQKIALEDCKDKCAVANPTDDPSAECETCIVDNSAETCKVAGLGCLKCAVSIPLAIQRLC